MAKVIVVAQNHQLRGVFTQRQKAFALLEFEEDLNFSYAKFCRVLRDRGRAGVEGGWAFWLTELNEEYVDDRQENGV